MLDLKQYDSVTFIGNKEFVSLNSELLRKFKGQFVQSIVTLIEISIQVKGNYEINI